VVIDPQYLRCVVFLFADVPDENTGKSKRTPAASGFLVAVGISEDRVIRYLVTNRHVASLSRKYGSLYARLHQQDGKAVFAKVAIDAWYEHPNTDVAATPIPGVALENLAIPIEHLEIDARVKEHNVGAGDNVFFVGLFSEHPGAERNEPIVRFGNIALMPEGEILVNTGDSVSRIRAYLVEARSWAGHSGLPAFVYFPPDRAAGRIVLTGEPNIFLLGLVQGHYNIEGDVKFVGDIDDQGSATVSMNAGIAVIVPAQDVYDLLMSGEIKEKREEAFGRAAS